ncbi:hypothetical protein DFH28DRAFT_1216238 [Melampsora americana]|nr:hypothetical protein DFH28DRAFT_1216238 [Melampsora americana]
MSSKNTFLSILFLYSITLLFSQSVLASKIPRSINLTPILTNTSFTNPNLTESNITSNHNLSNPFTESPFNLPNITDEINSTSNFLNASRLFTIQFTLSPTLNPIHENKTIKSVRKVLNGTIKGQSLNGKILGGISNSISQWRNNPSTSNSTLPPLPSFFIWFSINHEINSTVFITTQNNLPSINDQRLGRLTVEFENGKQFSKSLIFTTFGSQQIQTSFNSNDHLEYFIDAWGI